MTPYIIIRPDSHEQWLEARKQGIGSSEVATILGLNPYDTPYQLWLRKTGQAPPVQQNAAMRAGHILEEAVATYFAQETARQVIKASRGDWLAVDRQREYLRVSPDRTYWLEGKHSNDNKAILECKTTQMPVDADDIPAHWFCQIMYQLGVMGYRQGSLAWLTRGQKFGYIDVEFQADTYAYMVDRLEHFWKDNIIGGIEPEQTTLDDVMLKFPRSNVGKTITVTDELMADITTLKTLTPQIDELTRQKKDIEAKIKTFMADAEALVQAGSKKQTPIVLATWKSAKDSVKFDEKAFAAEHQQLHDSYLKQVTGSRRFLIK